MAPPVSCAAAALLGSMLFLGSAAAEPLAVSPDQPPTLLRDLVDVLEDPEARLRVEDVSVLPAAGAFRANPPGRELSFGDTRSAYWFRFTLANPTSEAIDLLLEVGYPPLNRIELYHPLVPEGFRSEVLGDTFPYPRRIVNVRHFLFPLQIPGGATSTYYLRVRSVGSLSVPLRVSAVVPYLEQDHASQLVLGLFYGILLGAALYNLFLLLSIRDVVYFYLVGHIVSLGLCIAGLDGLAFRFWPTATGWQQWNVYVSVSFISIFTILFVRRFVATAERSPGLDRLLKAALWTLLVTSSLIALWGVRPFFEVTVLWLMAVGLVLGFTVFWHARRGHRASQIYAIAWGVLLLALASSSAASLGLIPRFIDSILLLKAATAVEVILAAMAVAENLNETRRALATSESKFSRAFLSSPDAVVISTLDEGRFLEVNDGFEKLSGYRREHIIGRTSIELGLWQPEERRRMLEILQRQGRVREMETSIVPKSGAASPTLVSAEPIEIEGRPCLVAIIRDIALRRQEAEQRERLIGQLEAKNAELERFTYTVSHDLKSPLVTIGGFVGYLEKDALAGDVERVRHDVEQIRSASHKMRQLLDELLELSRIGRVVNPSEEIALSEIALEAAELVAEPARQQGIALEIAPDLPVVRGDRVRLLEVFQNLLDNAVRFLGDQAEPRIEIGQRRDGEETVCYVRDNGIGIDPKYHGKIFELFERLDADVAGTGIGLALVKRIVEFHGGRIWVESAGEGRGATFCFVIPAGNE